MGLGGFARTHWSCILFDLRSVSTYSVASSIYGTQFFFNNTDFAGQTQNLSAACAAEMQAPLSCDPSLLHIMMNNFYGMLGNETVQDLFCKPTCESELTQYRQRVVAACQGDLQPLPGYPATYWGDVAWSAWTTVCLKDPITGQYCAEVLAGIFNGSTSDGDGTDLPRDKLCSNCVVSLFRQIQGTPYSNYDFGLASPLETNVTTPGGYAQPDSGSKGCLSGKTFDVGDYCQLVAMNQTISLSLFLAIKPSIDSSCANLLSVFFLRDHLDTPKAQLGVCRYYIVQPGGYCAKIEAEFEISLARLQYWNPALKPNCSNLLLGMAYCVHGETQPQAGVLPLGVTEGITKLERIAESITAAAALEGGVPYGWPGLKGRVFWKGREGAALTMHHGF
ncbi:hypothetical protein B0T22DRAFT_474970 [Podospora appendiculata]|uniref:LysM domain-containing protein n=1 Tax=Podospora appendiculata TaxID=314037 RepID=A0AAE0XEF5_9PEZI|nr:hypothetical protein B0T22DRAFT_474970 [Podospora appendiculata]